MIEFFQELSWVVVGQIILIDILLGGDNAVVIALACRNLPPNLRLKGIVWGTFGAIVVRIALIGFAVTLLTVPYLKIVGGIMLLWIGVKLLSDHGEADVDIAASDRLFSAVKTVLIADLVMSIDNVIAVASAAEQAHADHKMVLVVFGILVSIPIIIWGSTIVLKVMEKFPVIVSFGAGLLGYLGGAMMVTDPVSAGFLASAIAPDVLPDLLYLSGFGLRLSLPGLVGAAGVVIVGHYLMKRYAAASVSKD